jgi:hypothetical protein
MNDTMACRKSSFSSAADNCIEVGDLAENGRVVRDSEDPTGPVLTVPLAQWAAFVGAISRGGFGYRNT